MRLQSLQHEEELIRNANDKNNPEWEEYQRELIDYESSLRKSAFDESKPNRNELYEYVIAYYTEYIEGAIKNIKKVWGLLPGTKEDCFLDAINKLMHPPYRFNEKQFEDSSLSPEALFNAIAEKCHLSPINNKPAISALKAVLKIPNFYKIVCNIEQTVCSDEEIKHLVNETESYRAREYKECTNLERQRIERLNRLVIEKIFSALTPRSLLQCALHPSKEGTIKTIISQVVSKSIVDGIRRISRIIYGKDIIQDKTEYNGDSIKSVTTLKYRSSFGNVEFESPQSIEILCAAVKKEFGDISLNVPYNTIDWLNSLLTQFDFYKIVREKYPDIFSVPRIKELTTEIEKYQGRKSNQKIDNNIKKLHRFLLEEIFQETPKGVREIVTNIPQAHRVRYETDNRGNNIINEKTGRPLIKRITIPKDPLKVSISIDDDKEGTKGKSKGTYAKPYRDADKLEEDEEQAIFLKALDEMDNREKFVLKFGINYYKQFYTIEDYTHAEIANKLSISRSYVSQMLSIKYQYSALNKLVNKISKAYKNAGMKRPEILKKLVVK